jgi:hypothetical protein
MGISLINIENNVGLKTAPCGTPAAIMNLRVIVLLILTANMERQKGQN